MAEANDYIGEAQVIDRGNGLEVGFAVVGRGPEDDDDQVIGGVIEDVMDLAGFLAEGWLLDGELKKVGDHVHILPILDETEE
jgi:hypothetical protein